MIVEANFLVDWRGDSPRELFMKPIFVEDLVMQDYRLLGNVVNSRIMPIIGQMGRVSQRDTGCNTTPKGSFNISERTLTTAKLVAQPEVCAAEFDDTVMEEALRRGIDSDNIDGTLIATILQEQVVAAVKNDKFRLFWFDQAASAHVDYGNFDGMWKLIDDAVSSGAIPAARYQNTGSGAPLAANAALAFFRDAYQNQATELKGMPNNRKRIYCTYSIYENYVETLENNVQNDYMRLVNGIEQVNFRGIPVVPYIQWDGIFDADFGQPQKHAFVLTVPENLGVGTDLNSTEVRSNEMITWFDLNSRKYKTRFPYKLGAQYVHESLFCVGY